MSKMIISEAHFYISSFLWGMALVAMYDVFRILRRIIPHRYFLIGLEDFIYWIVAACLVFRMIFQYNNGTIRIPGMIILFLGMFLYHYFISNPFVRFINKKIILPVKKFVGGLFRGLKKFANKVKMRIEIKRKKRD